LVLSLGFVASPPASALDWPRWRGPDLNGISKETGWSTAWPADGPKVLWRSKVGIGFSSFAVVKGRAYTIGNAGKSANQDSIFCFDAVTGTEVWRRTYDEKLDPQFYEGGPSATPTIDVDRVYTLSKSGQLHCLSAADGKVVWVKQLPKEVEAKNGKPAKVPTWGFAGSVLVVGDRLYVNVGTFGTALDRNGAVVWSTGSDASGYSTPVPFKHQGKDALAVFGGKAIAALDPASGTTLWSHEWITSYDVNAADPIISGDLVFISSGYNRGATTLRIQGAAVSPVWESKVMRNHFNSCLLIGRHLYGVDENELKCLELETGNVTWTEKSVGKGSLMAADGQLIVLSERGELLVAPADPAGFKPVARAQVLGGKCWSTPVLANARIYARNAAGDVVCLDLSK
jgi:outer membrane protein assembly factor BamB